MLTFGNVARANETDGFVPVLKHGKARARAIALQLRKVALRRDEKNVEEKSNGGKRGGETRRAKIAAYSGIVSINGPCSKARRTVKKEKERERERDASAGSGSCSTV